MNIDLLIHIGEISGGYITMCPKTVWRVNPDGELKDSYQRLTHVFEMPEQSFLNIMLIQTVYSVQIFRHLYGRATSYMGKSSGNTSFF